MRRTIGLDGHWERRDFLDEAWRWSDAVRTAGDGAAAGPPAAAGISAGWRSGSVPGSTLDDAWRAAEVPNPYVDRSSLAAEWVPQRTWLYRRRFTIPDDPGPFATLRFEGLDPGGTVLVDGVEVARHRGMFVPLEVPLRGRLATPGEHELVVALDPAPSMPSQVSRTELAREHRSRMGYGWDFCPRMVQTGIWRPVTLEVFRARLAHRRLSVDLADDHRSARVRIDAVLDGRADDGWVGARIIGPSGGTLAEGKARVIRGRVRIGLVVDEPELWWPNGIGGPALHRLELELRDDDGTLDAQELRFGIRSVALAPNEGAPADAGGYTLVVNGRRTWIRGWNWVPVDAAYGVPHPGRLRHLVELARRANVNLFRVWGGGLIESEAFYDACDEAGIMVWQEFALSSSGVGNTPPDDEAFVDLMRREAAALVPLRSRHPSLAIWGGGNELADADGRPLDERHPVLAALRDVVAREDPTRAWLPTSPTGPRFDNSLAAIASDPDSLHDVHGPWEHQGLAAQHELANATTSLLHSEFGVEGMTHPASLRATVTEPERWTADRSDPVLAHRGAWWNNRPFVERVFGGDLSLDELARASRHLQADGLRTLIEGDRRRWPRNAGAVPWAFDEPFPNAWSNAAVDWFGVPKGAYHAVAEAYAPILAGASFASHALDGATELRVTPWVANDTDEPLAGPMEVTLHDATGRCLASASVPLRAGSNAVATGAPATLGVPTDAADLLVLTLRFGGAVTRRLLSRTHILEPLRRLPPASLQAAVTDAGSDAWDVELTATGEVAAVELTLMDAREVGWPERTGAAYVGANMLTLLPGERRSVRVDWHEVPPADRRLALSGWNVAEREITRG